MKAVRLYGAGDLRVESLPHPGAPPAGCALLRVAAVGICGSDLHAYHGLATNAADADHPLILGHEFAAVVEDVAGEALDGDGQPLRTGQRVAVEPSIPCGRCEQCRSGHPNLCATLKFCGLAPFDGSLRQWMHMPAANCFPVPDTIDDASAALLEILGVAIHATELARITAGCSVAILGAGPIGLSILQTVREAGGDPIFVSDHFDWRLKLAERLGGRTIAVDDDAVNAVRDLTAGRGVDVAIEAAWGAESNNQAAQMARHGGRLVLVGIPRDERLVIDHAVARRKGLTIRMSRRMKHSYPRAIHMVESGAVDLKCLISHRFGLEQTPAAFALNAAYRDNVVKAVIDVSPSRTCPTGP